MIIYLAGLASDARKMQHRLRYEHVLLSKFNFSKRNLRWMRRRKEQEIEHERQSGKAAQPAERR